MHEDESHPMKSPVAAGSVADGDDVQPAERRPKGERKTAIGSEIRELRKARRLTLKAVSELTGVSLSYLSEIERGASNPSVDAMEAIAGALQVDVSWFFPSRHGLGPMERAHVVRANARRSLNSVYGRTLDEIGYADSLISSTIGGSFYMGIARFEPGKSGRRQVHSLNDQGEHTGLSSKGSSS